MAADEAIVPEEVVDGHHGGVSYPEETGECRRAGSQVREATSILAAVVHPRLERIILFK